MCFANIVLSYMAWTFIKKGRRSIDIVIIATLLKAHFLNAEVKVAFTKTDEELSENQFRISISAITSVRSYAYPLMNYLVAAEQKIDEYLF